MFGTWAYDVGRVAGVRVKIHATFALLLVLAAVFGAIGSGSVLVGAATAAVLTLHAGFVLLHELGHLTVARALGHPVGDVTLTPIGGIARIGDLGLRPRDEMLIAVAGPAVNFVLAAIFATLDFVFPSRFLEALVAVNLGLGLFNLLPAFPLDGGRVLRAFLAQRHGLVAGTQRAAFIGRGLAIVLGLVGLFLNPWLILIAAFIWTAGAQETALVEQLHARPRVEVLREDDGWGPPVSRGVRLVVGPDGVVRLYPA